MDAGESGPHPSTSALRADDVADPRVKGGEGTCGIGDQPPLLVNPVFRYTFVNGDRITTPAVGLAGSSWTKADTHNAANVAGAQEVGGGLFAGAGRASKTVSSDGQQVDGVGSGGSTCVVWRYRRMHQLQGANDEEVGELKTVDRNNKQFSMLCTACIHVYVVWPGTTVLCGKPQPQGNTADVRHGKISCFSSRECYISLSSILLEYCST